jgi:uncharacterized membrane protein
LSFKQRDNRVKNTIKKLRLIGGVFLSGKNCAILICIGMFIKLYLISLPFFFIIDFIWLAFIARKFYLEQLGLLMKTNINWIAAITFYLLFIVGLVIFAIQPAIEKKSILSAIIMGGLFGFFSYATYDLTNLAPLKNWPLTISLVDMTWGVILAGSVSALAYITATKLGV